MAKSMLVNVTHVEESRVAVLDDGVLDAYEIETTNRTHIKGNIYNAVVENVHPSLEAAFLRLSPDLKGFLPLDEVNFNLLPTRGEGRKGGGGRIGQHLHGNQRILAQVVREPFSGKPPTVSTYFSLPGRYLVLMPGVDSAGVSRKIEDSSQRDRLKKIAAELRPPEGFGVIVRTAGMGQTKQELQRDLRYLLRLWQSIQRASGAAEFPSLVYREADLVIRTIRDHFTPDISEVWIDSKETYDRALEFVRGVMPTKAKTMRLYTGDRPLFNKFNLEEQIETIYKRRVPLPSGGEIVIDGTEALTAIDVNSARSRRKGEAEDTALQTNMEAAQEIARQLRLRDLGGLIVIDFIDMMRTASQKKVEKELRDAMRGDKARHDITRMSKLGLVEIARQRLKGAKMGAMYNSCPTCEGYGLIKNVEAAALAALRKLQTRGARGDFGKLRLELPPDVAVWVLNNKRHDVAQVERRYRAQIEIVPVPEMLRHQTRIETWTREAAPEPAAHVVGDRIVPLPPSEKELEQARREESDSGADEERPEAEAEAGEARPAPRRRRRRRRRGGEGRGEDRGVERDAAEATDTDQPIRPEPREENERDEREAGSDERGEGDVAPGGVRKRRRRRRRRGGRSGDGDGPGDAEGSGNGADDDPRQAGGARAEEPVPAGVHSEELMPAAAAAGESRGGGGARRRRRGSRRRGSRGSGGDGGDGGD